MAIDVKHKPYRSGEFRAKCDLVVFRCVGSSRRHFPENAIVPMNSDNRQSVEPKGAALVDIIRCHHVMLRPASLGRWRLETGDRWNVSQFFDGGLVAQVHVRSVDVNLGPSSLRRYKG
jgi:hypothetical protein